MLSNAGASSVSTPLSGQTSRYSSHTVNRPYTADVATCENTRELATYRQAGCQCVLC